MSRTLTATMRLQLHKEFPLCAAREAVPYIHSLGVSHLYLSPILAASVGSAHGYDVIDPTRLNPELGTEDDLRALAADLHGRRMGIILDIVPNHMAASAANPYWDNVLERGQQSRYAEWFDIDWDAPRAKGRVVLPVLGDDLAAVLERDEITLHIRDSGSRIAYFDKTFPLDPATLPKEIQLAQFDPSGRPAAEQWAEGEAGRARLRKLLDAQNYQLTSWRSAGEMNYRRFFDVNDLVAVRMETDEVFDATHALVLGWVREGLLDGLRVDHVDGLRSPSWYLARLRRAVDESRHPEAPEPFPIFVEKILSGDEQLPREWPVQGTTGYDFLNDVEDLFIDASGYDAIEAAYRGLRHNPELNFDAIAREGKRRSLTGPLWPDVMRAARLAHRWRFDASVKEIADAIVELIVHLDVYRSYVSEPGIVSHADRPRLERAFTEAARSQRVSAPALALLRDAFFAKPSAADPLRDELVARLQQTSGPATAKGVEDTALYVYVPLASRNEVGGAPDRPLADAAARTHARNLQRATDWPHTMLTANTHDTKRSADVRSRLDVLSTMPSEWARYVARWRRLNKPLRRVVRGKLTPDTNAEYLYYQMLFGLWPAQRPERRADDLPERGWLETARDRLKTYMLKAVREAKTRTSWTDADEQYEQAVQAFVQGTLLPEKESHFLPDMARLTALTANAAFSISLARLVIQCTAPGVPDLYQGYELWDFSMVDPDNRRPVDFELRMKLLAALDVDNALQSAVQSERFFEPRVKLAFSAALLRFRRDHAALLSKGSYLPVESDPGVFAFVREVPEERSLTIARTRFRETTSGVESRLTVPRELAGRWTSALTGRSVELDDVGQNVQTPLSDLVEPGRPCELLFQRKGD
ncbi:MAG TPA: malto-oligosyltrehalose synthase [Gemmatimonadaceae bacterium]|nr:malto-oligosyltrehalose synthase [Gemmatimonadaceae bacterium]